MGEQEVLGVAVIGLGKMGISHLAIANANPKLQVAAVVDSSALVGQMVGKYCNLTYHGDYKEAIAQPQVKAVIVSTPTRSHEEIVRESLARGLHVFCEKPMTLSSEVSYALADEAGRRGVVGQVGYHNRFVGTFAEAKRLIDADAIGRLRHVHAEAYGPVVLRPSGGTWRSRSSAGGGCLLDYAAHPINLMNWYVGLPEDCLGANLPRQYSAEVEDAVYAELRFPNAVSGQVSVNWSDETMRKMTTRLTLFGDGGKLVVDRQELQLYVGARGTVPDGYGKGWSIRNTVELTPPVDYYLRGEEYTAQMDSFALSALAGQPTVNDFRSAADTDRTLEMIRQTADGIALPRAAGGAVSAPPRRGLLARITGR